MNLVIAIVGDPEKSVSEIESVECYPMVSYYISLSIRLLIFQSNC